MADAARAFTSGAETQPLSYAVATFSGHSTVRIALLSLTSFRLDDIFYTIVAVQF